MVSFPSGMNKTMTNVFFGVKKTDKFFLDEKQYVEFKKLNEGELTQFQDSTAGRFIMDQEAKKGEIIAKDGSTRSALIKLAVCGYKITLEDGTELTEFSKDKWENDLYPSMDGDMAAKLYTQIRVFNGFEDAKKK